MNARPQQSIHPMLGLFRPTVATREIEHLSDAINAALDVSYRGLSVYAFARFGKTEAITYLISHPEWIAPREAALRSLIMPKADKRTDGSFISTLLYAFKVRVSPRSTPDERFNLLISYLIECCHQACGHLVIVFIDEAQRMKPADHEHLVTIDNWMTSLRYYVFFVFVNQRDITGFSNESMSRSEHPPHVHGRFLVRKHEMCGVHDPEDAAYILGRYDHATEFPAGSGISFSEHFAPEAFRAGWRLAQHAARLWEIASNLRTEHRLSQNWTWPMKSFEAVIAYLLTVVAPRQVDFAGLSDDELKEAITASGYIELEQSRETYLPSREEN